ncbi:MAG: TolC family protein [Armatimonadota bacterium]
MTIVPRIIIAVALALIALPILAQEPLTLEAAIQYARTHHPALLAAHEDVIAATATVRGAKVLSNPEITITPGVLGSAGSDEVFSLSQPLEVNGVRTARTKVATGHLDAARADIQIAERDVVLAVKTAYWDLAQAQALVAVDIENVQHAEALLTAANKQVELGNEPTSHAMKVEIELIRARQQLARTQATVRHAMAILNTAIGRVPSTPIMLAETLTMPTVAFNETELLQLGLIKRPEIARAQAMVRIGEGEVDGAKASRRPDIAVQVRQEDWGGNGGAGVGISLPLIDWGYAKAERQRATAALHAQQQRIEVVRNAVRQDIAAALVGVRTAESQLQTLRGQVLDPAEKLAAMAQLGYQEGATNYLEVLEARRTVRAVKEEYIVTLGEYHKALAQLTWAAGVETLPIPEKEITR